MRINSHRDVWKFCGGITLFAAVCAELCIAGLYYFGGPEAFHVGNAIKFAALMAVMISLPITYYIARVHLALTFSQSNLRALAETDPLTRLPNRRSFFEAATTVLENQSGCTSLLVIDADHFKELNDTYGHATGDVALVAIADVLRKSFRTTDLICRVGGEEFAVLLPGIDMVQAERLATRVVKKVANNPICEIGAIIEYSVSCGVADTTVATNIESLFKAADDAMYMAKNQGRNRVVLLPKAA